MVRQKHRGPIYNTVTILQPIMDQILPKLSVNQTEAMQENEQRDV